MDNSNNPNSPANPNSTSPFGGPLQQPPTPTQPEPPAEPGPMPPPPPPPPFPSPVPSWPPVPEPAAPATEPAPLPVTPPVWPQDPIQTNPGVGSSDLSSAWTPPASVQQQTPTTTQPEPIPPVAGPTVSNPWSNPQPSIDPLSSQQTSAWTPSAPSGPEPILQPDLPLANPTPAQSEPTPIQSEPTPTFTPPITNPAEDTSEPPSVTSPLNNPWETTPSTPTQPSWMTSPTETAPTDLSHLISNNQQEPTPAPTAESLVMPTAGVTPDVPNLPTEAHKGIPKWLIGLSVGLLIIVLGASAYFILGIGQPSKGTVSLPATTTPQTSQVKPPLPIATPSTQPTTSSSANFGQLGGTPPATSAADLIRQRQQER